MLATQLLETIIGHTGTVIDDAMPSKPNIRPYHESSVIEVPRETEKTAQTIRPEPSLPPDSPPPAL